MKTDKKRSLLVEVYEAAYEVGGRMPHSPSMNVRNFKRLDRIIEKMRKAGITAEEINFIQDFAAADAVHFLKLTAAAEQYEEEKRRKKASEN